MPADTKVLRNEVLVARGSAKPPSVDKDIDAATEKALADRLSKTRVDRADLNEVRKQIREQIKSELSDWSRRATPNAGASIWAWQKIILRDRPLYLRIKFNSADKSPSGTFGGLWAVGEPQKTALWRSDVMSLAPDTFHEFAIDPNLFDENGVLTVQFFNGNDTALLFPLDDGIEVLYREGGFGLNFVRGLGIIFCWMALLAALAWLPPASCPFRSPPLFPWSV